MLIKSKKLNMNSKKMLLDEFNHNNDLTLLISEIQKYHKEVNIIKQTDTLQLEFVAEEDEEGLKVDVLFVTLSNEIIIQAIKETDGLHLKAHFSAVNENGEKVIRKAIVKDNQIEIEFEIPFETHYFMFVEELKNPQGADKDFDASPEAWYEGCLVFFDSASGKYYRYNYCGAKCTGEDSSGKKYQKTPINTLDRCCRTHDRCWDNFGHGDDDCDYNLYSCANKTSDPGWWMVAEFGLKCSKGELGSIC